MCKEFASNDLLQIYRARGLLSILMETTTNIGSMIALLHRASFLLQHYIYIYVIIL